MRLEANAALAALVDNRIHWNKAPHNLALPCLVYRRIGGGPVRAMGSDTGMQLTRWLFVALAHTPEDAVPVLDQVKISLNRLHATTVAGVFIDSIFMDDAEDIDLEADIDTGAEGAVYSINYRE